MSLWREWQMRYRLRRFTSTGEQPRLHGSPTIYNDGEMSFGDRFQLSSRPVESHLAAGPGASIQIGNDVSIGCGAAIAAFQLIRIGDGTRIGPYAIIMDTNFHSAGDQAIQHDCRPVIIGSNCRIGSRVTITRGATIGDGAEVLAGSVVSTDVPPGACVAGARARIIGRAGDPASRWESPVARLPDILMSSLQLASPPDLDDSAIPGETWTDAAITRLAEMIRTDLGRSVDDVELRQARSYADVADILRVVRAQEG